MIVRVEPLLHGEGLDVTLVALVASCGGKICVDRGKTEILIALRDRVKEESGIQNVIVEGKIVAGDEVDPCALLRLEIEFSLHSSGLQKLGFTDLAREVLLACKL